MGLTPVADGYNSADRPENVEASFASLAVAQAYADEYGGEVEARGTAFVVRDADHARAKDDLAAGSASDFGSGKKSASKSEPSTTPSA